MAFGRIGALMVLGCLATTASAEMIAFSISGATGSVCVNGLCDTFAARSNSGVVQVPLYPAATTFTLFSAALDAEIVADNFLLGDNLVQSLSLQSLVDGATASNPSFGLFFVDRIVGAIHTFSLDPRIFPFLFTDGRQIDLAVLPFSAPLPVGTMASVDVRAQIFFVPEPSSALLIGGGVFAILQLRLRKRPV